MEDEEEPCPICTEPLTGTLATLGCCKKMLHVECLIKCMKIKLDCPMCRTRHESLRMVQDVESQVIRIHPLVRQHAVTKTSIMALATMAIFMGLFWRSYS